MQYTAHLPRQADGIVNGRPVRKGETMTAALCCANCGKSTSSIYYHPGGTCPFCGWVEGSVRVHGGEHEYPFADCREPDPAGPEHDTATTAVAAFAK